MDEMLFSRMTTLESGEWMKDAYSTHISGASTDLKKRILRNIASGEVSIGAPIDFYNGPSNELGKYSGGMIRINIDSMNFISGNFYDFKLNLIHENAHRTTDPNITDKNRREYIAYGAIINSSDFDRASDFFKRSVIAEYNNCKKALGL